MEGKFFKIFFFHSKVQVGLKNISTDTADISENSHLYLNPRNCLANCICFSKDHSTSHIDAISSYTKQDGMHLMNLKLTNKIMLPTAQP